MKKTLIIWAVGLLCLQGLLAQQTIKKSKPIYKVSKELLAGEGLPHIKQKDSTKKVYQKKIYDGKNLSLYIVAIGTGITNEFTNFPLEGFIFWINGKAIVNPANEASFEVHSGDYFIQAKGFKGTWHFVDNGGLHLELALIAKNRPDSLHKSPISKALVIDRNIISGIQKNNKKSEIIYSGAELDVKLIRNKHKVFEKNFQECMLHVINGIVEITDDTSQEKQIFYPGDFFIIPEEFKGSWSSSSLQDLRILEVTKAINK